MAAWLANTISDAHETSSMFSTSDFRFSISDSRRGFTLIELMIVVSILGVVATMIAFALVGAANTAKIEKTKSMISKLDNYLMLRWDKYETWRLPPTPDQVRQDPKSMARLRLNGLREMMRLEFPDHWKDVQTEPTDPIKSRPAASRAYLRRFKESRDKDNKPSSMSEKAGDYKSAECLYMILTTPMNGQESVLSQFRDSEMGDVDEDGFPEFLDAWRNPIMFMRWAPGHISPRQPAWKRDPKKYHDPYDVLQVDDKAFALYPLIYSSGPDEQYDIYRKEDSGGRLNDPFGDPQLGEGRDQDNYMKGAKDGVDNSKDNITNHMLQLR